MAAAVVGADGSVRASIVHSQVELHAPYGGVVPELASRDHVRSVGLVIRAALKQANVTLDEIDGIAVTCGPGLIGSLLCGVEAAKGIAMATGKPLLGVHHLEGHIAAAYLEDPPPQAPFMALIVSGGHTSIVRVESLGGRYELIGATRDDAAGEAFDKTAKLLGLGYPGGVAIDRLATNGDPRRYKLPSAMPGRDNFEFSFSGLKTAAARMIEQLGGAPSGRELEDFCASFQAAVVENLLKKAFRAAIKLDTPRLVLAGGVAANSALRREAELRGRRQGVRVWLPSRANCTDNAAMIARAGWTRLSRGERDPLDLASRAHWRLTDERT
jgi:N6-L-threonylcarbamoyladenine synthase